MLGRLLHFILVPGFVRPTHFKNEYVEMDVRTSPQYTILTVNGIEFFFRRGTGEFDGVGAMSSDAPSNVRSDWPVGHTPRSIGPRE